MASNKVKCRICGKVASDYDLKGQKLHLLSHNIRIPLIYKTDEFFEETDPNAIVEIMSESRKVKQMERNSEWTNWSKGKETDDHQFTRIIYTPMGNKR